MVRAALLIAIAMIPAAMVAPQLRAQEPYPSRTIRLIVPFTPGTGADILARTLGQKIGEDWKASVIVENRPGASGNIGTEAVAKAAPDGYTLLTTANTIVLNRTLFKTIPYDPVKDFAPIAPLAVGRLALVTHPSLPVKSVSEFIAYAKANPGKLNFGATIGTPPHLVGELFKVTTGADIYYIPYKGAAQAMTDLLAGQMHMTIEGATTLLAHIQSGKVRPLAVMSPQRLPALPDVPTMLENGYSGFPSASWTGVLAPAGTPASIVSKLNAAVNDALRSPEISANFARFSAQAKVGSPQDFAAFIAVEAPKWAALVRDSGAKLE